MAEMLIVFGVAAACSSEDNRESAQITLKEAEEIALSDAGFSAEDVRFTRTELDYEDGQKIYEIEFYKEAIEYEYEINAINGEIVKYKKE